MPGQPKAQDLFRLVGGKRSSHPEHPSGATLKLSRLQGTLGQPCSQRASGAHFPRLETRTHVSSFSQADEPPHILEFRQRPLPWLPEAPDGPLLCPQEQLRERQSRGRPAAWVPAVRVPRRLVCHSVVSLPSPLPDHPGACGDKGRAAPGWLGAGRRHGAGRDPAEGARSSHSRGSPSLAAATSPSCRWGREGRSWGATRPGSHTAGVGWAGARRPGFKAHVLSR